MSQLVKISVGESQALSKRGDLSSEEIHLIVSNTTNVFHSSKVVLWNENLIVLIKWVSLSEQFLVEFHTSLSHCEHLLEVALSNDRLSCIDSHIREVLIISLMEFIRSSNDSIEVS